MRVLLYVRTWILPAHKWPTALYCPQTPHILCCTVCYNSSGFANWSCDLHLTQWIYYSHLCSLLNCTEVVLHDLQFTVDLVQPVSFFCLKQAVLAPFILNLSQLFLWLAVHHKQWVGPLRSQSHMCPWDDYTRDFPSLWPHQSKE